MAAPEMANVAAKLNIGRFDGATEILAGLGVNAKVATYVLTGKDLFNPSERAMYEAAQERGIFDAGDEKIDGVSQSKAGRIYDEVVDLNRKYPEKATRPAVYFAAVRILEGQGITGKVAYDTAMNITNSAMVDYHLSERPMMYQRLGLAGRLAGGLQTFKHAQLNQLSRLVKEAGKGNVAPVMQAGLTMIALAGVTGVPFYQELDSLVGEVTDRYFDGRKTIKELALQNVPDIIKLGYPTYESEVNVQSRMSAADVLPNSPLEAVSPYAKVAAGIGEAGYDLLTKQDPLAAKNFAVAMSPSGPIKGMVRDAFFTDENGTSYDKRGEVIEYGTAIEGGKRTPFDVKMAKLGVGQTLNEAKNNENFYVNNLRKLSNEKAQGKITENLKRKYVQGIMTEEDVAEASKKYMARDGDPQQLVNSLIQYAQTTPLTRKQRAEGVPGKTLSSIYRYQNYQQTQ
jgi:hypothetical protein